MKTLKEFLSEGIQRPSDLPWSKEEVKYAQDWGSSTKISVRNKILNVGKLEIVKRLVNSKTGKHYYSNKFADSDIVTAPPLKVPYTGDWRTELKKSLRDVRYTK